MTRRYTRRDAQAAYVRLRDALGKSETRWTRDETTGRNVANVGSWRLEYAACYGGFMVQEVVNDSGGVSCPFGHGRMPAREFCGAVRFALDTLDIASGGPGRCLRR